MSYLTGSLSVLLRSHVASGHLVFVWCLDWQRLSSDCEVDREERRRCLVLGVVLQLLKPGHRGPAHS